MTNYYAKYLKYKKKYLEHKKIITGGMKAGSNSMNSEPFSDTRMSMDYGSDTRLLEKNELLTMPVDGKNASMSMNEMDGIKEMSMDDNDTILQEKNDSFTTPVDEENASIGMDGMHEMYVMDEMGEMDEMDGIKENSIDHSDTRLDTYSLSIPVDGKNAAMSMASNSSPRYNIGRINMKIHTGSPNNVSQSDRPLKGERPGSPLSVSSKLPTSTSDTF